MDKKTATELIIQSIKNKKVKFQDLATATGNSLIFTIHALRGQATLDQPAAEKIGEILSLSPELVASLQEIPLRSLLQTTSSDPTLYRLVEMMQHYGPDIKAAINELFGDGAMSGIDFKIAIEKVESPNGARIQLILDGKFLPFQKF